MAISSPSGSKIVVLTQLETKLIRLKAFYASDSKLWVQVRG